MGGHLIFCPVQYSLSVRCRLTDFHFFIPAIFISFCIAFLFVFTCVYECVLLLYVQVIEVFIRSEEGLSRDMVKHLNSIEEQVLESRAWTADSALWSALQAAGYKIPTVEEVSRMHTLTCLHKIK